MAAIVVTMGRMAASMCSRVTKIRGLCRARHNPRILVADYRGADVVKISARGFGEDLGRARATRQGQVLARPSLHLREERDGRDRDTGLRSKPRVVERWKTGCR